MPSPALPLQPPLLAAHPAPSDLLSGEREGEGQVLRA